MKSTKTRSSTAGTAVKSSSSGARFAGLKTRRAGLRLTWSDVPPSDLLNVVSQVVEAGCLISFGRTSDGGALVLSILDDGEATRFYMSSEEDVVSIMSDVLEVAQTI